MHAAISDPRVRFLARLAGWSLLLLAVLRSPMGIEMLVRPFMAWHTAFAVGFRGSSVTVDLSCSGSDVIALSIAAIVAYPASWRRRLSGAATAALGLAGLNLVRVITLVHTAGSSLFVPLHTYLWPAVMIAASAAFVCGWIWTGRRPVLSIDGFARFRRVAMAFAALSVVYVAISPWLLRSEALGRAAILLATGAAAVLRALGADALVGGSTLLVGERAYLVTPECIVTPLMPAYLAWATIWPATTGERLRALVMFGPLFVGLGLLRLLTVALPAMIGPPLFLTHGFYQFVVAIVLGVFAAKWRAVQAGTSETLQYFVHGLLTALVVAAVLGQPYAAGVDALSRLLGDEPSYRWAGPLPALDVQGALAIMPAFQLSLLCGLSIALLGRRAVRMLAVLIPAGALLQAGTLIVARQLGSTFAADLPTTSVRAISLLTPAALVMVALTIELRRRARAVLVEARK